MFRIFSIICMLFSISSIKSQSTDYNRIINSKLEKEKKIIIIDSLLSKVKLKQSDSLGYYYSNFSSWLYANSEHANAIKFGEKAILEINRKKRIDTILLQETLYKLGVFLQKSKPKDAIKYYSSVIKLNSLHKKAYYKLGYVNLKINNPIKALDYFEITAMLLKNDNSSLLHNTCLQIINICSNFGDLEHLKKGIIYGKYVDSLIQNSKLNKYKFSIKLRLASLYNKHKTLDVEKSKKLYFEALKIAKTENDSIKISLIFKWLGNLYNTTDYKKSLRYLNQSLDFSKKHDSVNLRELYYNYSLTYARKGDYLKSIMYNHKSLQYFIGNDLVNFKEKDKQLLMQIKNKLVLLEILPTLADTYLKLFKNYKKEIYLKKSIEYFKLTDYVIDLAKINSNEFKSKLFWRKISADIYGKAIKACYLNNNIKEALFFMEKNKALLLVEDIVTQNYRLTIDIPKKLLDKEINYKRQLSTINQILNLNSNDSILKLKIDLQRELHTFQDSIYKGENKRNIEPEILTVTDIQNDLNENEVFISYHVSKDNGFGIVTNNDNGYVIFISKQKTFFQELNDMIRFKKELRLYLETLKKPFENKTDIENFNEKSYAIFNKLFPTKTIKELIQNKKIIISSNDILTFLPFESLVTQKESNNYLIYSSEISYTYSMSFQEENKKRNRLPQKEFLGIAPIQFVDSLAKLPNTKKEIANLKKIFTGKLLTNENATKHNFNLISNDYNIIHFATHADASDTNEPWIAFKNKKLGLSELYTTKTQADLIVLSACNTSLGKIETGEGVMSLARGFFYSGANSVVSSLWNVNDKVTSEIMISFYKKLKKGDTKSKALHEAKLNYLNTHSKAELSPYYWSTFVLMGDTGELALVDSGLNYSYIIVVGLVILVCFIFFSRRFSQKIKV